VGDRDVRELGVVRGARRADRVPRFEAIGVDVVTSRLGDGIGEVPRVGESKVVRVVGETDGVLIEERGAGDRVRRREGDRDEASIDLGGGDRGVVGLVEAIETAELLLKRVVAGLEREDDDGVGEADVEG